MLRAWRAEAWGRAGLAAVVLAVPLYAAVLEGVAPRLRPSGSRRASGRCSRRGPRASTARDSASPAMPSPPSLFAVGGGTQLLRRGEDAARFLAEAPARRVVAVGDRAMADFRREAAARGLAPRAVGRSTGFNYTRGRWVTLTLFRGPA